VARVLVADDNEAMRQVLELTLHQGGHEVLPPATDGAEALAFARAALPDAALLDAMMPRVHGFDVCRQLKSDPATRAIRVVMVTAKSADADRAEGLAAGADAYVTKPFSPRALLELLAATLAAGR
jgi:two-component system alkaline phosphatase synthesis response regulator PhoP